MAYKFTKEYQPKDPNTGDPIGPKQVFGADTEAELIDKIAAAHENASTSLYKTRQAAKLGSLLSQEPDAGVTFKNYEETVLSADERVHLATALKDPANTQFAIKKLLTTFGIPADDIREMLQEREDQKRINFANEQVALFDQAHPEYVGSDFNNERMLKYLNKHNMSCTKKNLEIAYADLTRDELLTVRAPEQPTPAATVTEVAAAPALEQAIPVSATPAAPISEVPTEVRPQLSSSGLSSRGSSAASASGAAPKVAGITHQDVLKMTSEDFDKALQRGLFNIKGEQTMTAKEFRNFADTM